MTRLEQLPARIDDLTSQVSQLRTEVRVEFSAVRKEMANQGATIIATLRSELADQGTSLSAEIGSLATHIRVLHEDVISRIAQLQEGWAVRPRRKPKATSLSILFRTLFGLLPDPRAIARNDFRLQV